MRLDRFDGPEIEYLRDVLDSGQFAHSDTRYVGRFERAFAEAYASPYAVAGNAAMSLLIASLHAAGVGVGDEVLCDPLVQFHAIAALWLNAHPVFADVRAGDWLLDPASVRANLTPQTRAIVCTHLWGLPCEVDTLRQIADEAGVLLIEDCAHAMFLPYREKWVGTWGHLGVFSLCQGKHMTTGDGGMVLTADEELARRARSVTMFGESPPELATVFRMTELQAAVGLGQLERVPGYLAEYRKSYAVLDAVVQKCPWLQARVIREGSGNSPYWYSFQFRGEEHGVDFGRFKQALFESGENWMVGFTQVPAYRYPLFTVPRAYQNRGCPLRGCPYYQGSYEYREGLCPVAEEVLPRLVSISCMVGEEEANRIARALEQAIEATEGA